MDNRRVADMLDEIGTLIELKEDNAFRARAYHNASRVVQNLTRPIDELLATGEIERVPGLGKEMRAHITELQRDNHMTLYDELVASIEPGMIDMLQIGGLGPKRIRLLHEQLGVKTLEDLAEACRQGRVASVPGMGAKTQANILKGIEFLTQQQSLFNYADVVDVAETIVAQLRAIPGVMRANVAGSLRRRKETVHDIDAVAGVTDATVATALMQTFTTLPQVVEIMGHGDTKSSVRLASGVQMDLRVVTDDAYATALHHFSGSKDHNIALRRLAGERDIKINEYGLWRGEERLAVADETALYATLGLAFIEPELREDRGEIAAAQAQTLPPLITTEAIRGALHCHSTWSDGKASIREMADGCRALGYRYLGLCDHSQFAVYAHGLTPDQVRRQHEEIDKLNASFDDGFVILKGTECDILKDGALDFDDTTLELFDFVVASIHSNFGLSEAEETARLIRAIQNPYTTIMGHLTGRLLLRREGYPVDVLAVIEAAAARGVAIELNANPARFDMDWRWQHHAIERGVKIPICPDAHEVGGINDIRYGVGIARKGWVTADDVPNAWDIDRLKSWFAAVRRQGLEQAS